MIGARRDPPFGEDAYDLRPVRFADHAPVKAPKVLRFATVVQMIGSMIAVPVGIGSAYTFYRANFSPEATCQSLRGNIIALLDKGMDASARRILVRRDVEAFEKDCAAVDPEAAAAFKSLLASDKSVAPAAAASAAKVQSTDAAAKEAVRKTEPRPQPAAKQAVVSPQPPAVQGVRKEPVSDAQWLDAVRQALTTRQEVMRPSDNVKPRLAPGSSARPVQRETEPAAAVTAPSTPAAAPTLPTPVPVAPTPARQNPRNTQAADHPVPPEAIPDPAEPAAAAQVKADEESRRSRIGKWISAIPLLGQVVDNARR